MQFMNPPISATNRPSFFRTFFALSSTPFGSRLHQCSVALLNTASNLTAAKLGGKDTAWASDTKVFSRPFSFAFSICDSISFQAVGKMTTINAPYSHSRQIQLLAQFYRHRQARSVGFLATTPHYHNRNR